MNFFKIILFISYILLLNSCSIWNTQTTDIPLINKKNDLRIDAGISMIPSAHATVSYGLTNLVTVQMYGNIGSDDKYYLQSAIGIYKTLKDRKVNELYGGFGYGYGKRNPNTGEYYYGDYQLYFLQYNWGIVSKESSNFETGIGIKSGYLHQNITATSVTNRYPDMNYTNESIIVEPVTFIRMGGNKLRFTIKFGVTLYSNIKNSRAYTPNYTSNFSIGLNYRL